MTEVVLPDSVTELGGDAFADCTSLTSLTLSKNMTETGSTIVIGCKKLETLVIPGNITKVDPLGITTSKNETFRGNYPNLTIYGEPNSAADLYAFERDIPFAVIEP